MSDKLSSVRWNEDDQVVLAWLREKTGLQQAELLRLSLRVLRSALEFAAAAAAAAIPDNVKKKVKK